MIELDPSKIPQHVAMIMDGNGRWATRQNLHRSEGHKRGAERVEEIVVTAREIGVRYLTLYAFSHENWKRPDSEVTGLMELLCHFLVAKREKFLENRIRFRTIGEVDRLPGAALKELTATMEATSRFDDLTLILALSYGSRQEISQAAEKLIRKRLSSSNPLAPIEPEEFSQGLQTHGIPDPDLLIRTSGEHRISNFMLWQTAYTELYFTDTLWPDFKKDEFLRAIAEYQSRERRFGLTSDQIREFD